LRIQTEEGATGSTIEVSVGLIKRMLEDQYDHIPNLTSRETDHLE
jgi:hypothetical protein